MADQYVSYNGAQYDPRILGAPLETIRLRARLDEARASGADTLALGLAVESFERILEDRLAGEHTLARRADNDQVCTCGLIVAPGDDLTAAAGHLDQEAWVSLEAGPELLTWDEQADSGDSEPVDADEAEGGWPAEETPAE